MHIYACVCLFICIYLSLLILLQVGKSQKRTNSIYLSFTVTDLIPYKELEAGQK